MSNSGIKYSNSVALHESRTGAPWTLVIDRPRWNQCISGTSPFAMARKQEEALRILRELRNLAKKRYISPFELALIHFAMGQVDHGFEWLAKAYQDRCFELMAIRVDPRFDTVVDDPRFMTLFKKLGLP